MQISYTKILIGSGLLLGLAVIVKYNRNMITYYSNNNPNNKSNNKSNHYPDNLQPEIIKLDETTSISNLKNSDIKNSDTNNNGRNNIETQTVVSLDKNDRFLVKEIIVGNGNKWYDIIDENIDNMDNIDTMDNMDNIKNS